MLGENERFWRICDHILKQVLSSLLNQEDIKLILELTSDDPRVQIGHGTHASGTPLLRLHHPNNQIIIGKFCSFAYDVTVFSGGNHPMNFVTTYALKLYFDIDEYSDWTDDCGDGSETTHIGNDVWIGHGACILSGANIGDGAVVGAHAVVRGTVPPYAIVFGNPSQVMRYRFDQETIAKLLAVKWWDWPENKIKEFARDIASPNVSEFLAIHF